MIHYRAMTAGMFLFSSMATALAGSLYVNADFGDDDKYDGSSPTVVSATVGPKGTLMGALSLAQNGDTVYAAAGMYTNGVYTTSGGIRYRAHVTGGVTLVGEGPDKTFIVGEKDPAGDGNGCGANAVCCVYLEYDSTTTLTTTQVTTQTTTTTTTETVKPDKKTPKTGDGFALLPIIIITMLSATGIFTVISIRKS